MKFTKIFSFISIVMLIFSILQANGQARKNKPPAKPTSSKSVKLPQIEIRQGGYFDAAEFGESHKETFTIRVHTGANQTENAALKTGQAIAEKVKKYGINKFVVFLDSKNYKIRVEKVNLFDGTGFGWDVSDVIGSNYAIYYASRAYLKFNGLESPLLSQRTEEMREKLYQQVKEYSQDGKGVGAVLLFEKKNRKLAVKWQERTRKYFADLNVESLVLIGESSENFAMFCVKGEGRYFPNLPYEDSDLDYIVIKQKVMMRSN